jgi:hypothetical protein
VILKNRDIRMRGDLSDKGSLDLEPGEILEVQHPSLGMPALAGEIEFTNAVLEFPFVEVHPKPHEFLNAGRPFRDDGAHHDLIAKTPAAPACRECESKGLLRSPHKPPRPVPMPYSNASIRHHERYEPLLCRFQRE